MQAHRLQEVELVGLVEVGDLGFDRGAQRDDLRAFLGGVGFDLGEQRVVGEAVFGHVGRVEHRLGGDQAEGLEAGPFLLGQVEAAYGLALVKLGKALFQHSDQDLGFLIT